MAKRKRQPKWKPDVSKAWVTWTPVGFGVMLWMLFVPDFVAPVGLVWGTQHGGKRKLTFNTYYSFVLPGARRCGVRTRINQEILKTYDLIVTGSGTKQGGMAFIKAAGYRYNKELDVWSLQRKGAR
jgi:hypothetical protein